MFSYPVLNCPIASWPRWVSCGELSPSETMWCILETTTLQKAVLERKPRNTLPVVDIFATHRDHGRLVLFKTFIAKCMQPLSLLLPILEQKWIIVGMLLFVLKQVFIKTSGPGMSCPLARSVAMLNSVALSLMRSLEQTLIIKQMFTFVECWLCAGHVSYNPKDTHQHPKAPNLHSFASGEFRLHV